MIGMVLLKRNNRRIINLIYTISLMCTKTIHGLGT